MAFGKGCTWFNFIVRKHQLVCFYLKNKPNPQEQAKNLQQARTVRAPCQQNGLLGYTGFVFVLNKDFAVVVFVRICTKESHGPHSQPLLLTKNQKAPPMLPTSLSQVLVLFTKELCSGHGSIAQQVCGISFQMTLPSRVHLGYIFKDENLFICKPRTILYPTCQKVVGK